MLLCDVLPTTDNKPAIDVDQIKSRQPVCLSASKSAILEAGAESFFDGVAARAREAEWPHGHEAASSVTQAWACSGSGRSQRSCTSWRALHSRRRPASQQPFWCSDMIQGDDDMHDRRSGSGARRPSFCKPLKRAGSRSARGLRPGRRASR